MRIRATITKDDRIQGQEYEVADGKGRELVMLGEADEVIVAHDPERETRVIKPAETRKKK